MFSAMAHDATPLTPTLAPSHCSWSLLCSGYEIRHLRNRRFTTIPYPALQSTLATRFCVTLTTEATTPRKPAKIAA
ncbi:hypothetical protein VTK56DRAFT_441 [Thermocarpiscus australiensis]